MSALFTLSGDVSNNVTWSEDIYFLQSGAGMDLTGLSFQLQFRAKPPNTKEPNTAAFLTLSTAGGELVITDDDNSVASILRIGVPYTTISSMVGEYQTDLVSKDVSGTLTHWSSGVVTFSPLPIAF